jgi:hypothetical protein
MRWSAGEAAVERLLAAGHIERVPGAQADGESWLDRARRSLEAAETLQTAAEIIAAAARLVPKLGFF